jgi:hypothetical protein
MQNVIFKNAEVLLRMNLQTTEHATWWVNGEQLSSTFTLTPMQHNHRFIYYHLGDRFKCQVHLVPDGGLFAL